MDRRSFLLTSVALSSLSLSPVSFATEPDWRTFEVTTRVNLKSTGPAKVWLPVPIVNTDYQTLMGSTFVAEGATATLTQQANSGIGVLTIEFDGDHEKTAELTSRFSTRDRSINVSAPAKGIDLAHAGLKKYLAPTALIPIDGIVRTTALEATAGAKTDLDKARAIYEWVVDNASRNPKVRGCGIGDIKAMLEIGDLSGKCADLSALFVGLARASGIPARDVYGLRVADSRLGYKSLGKAGDITKAQHCRAEFYLSGHGWVPVDPADVRKVILEEAGGLPIDDPKVVAARKRLFGSWEMNWVALNYASDVVLPHTSLGKIGFFMYPNAENTQGRVDSLDPANFEYQISSREIMS